MERAIEITVVLILIIGALSGKGSTIQHNSTTDQKSVSTITNQATFASDNVSYTNNSYGTDSNPSIGYKFYKEDYEKYSQYSDPQTGYEFYLEDMRRNAPAYIVR